MNDWRPEGWGDDDPWTRPSRPYKDKGIHPARPLAIAVMIILTISWFTFGIYQALNGLIVALLAWSAGVLHERYSGR